MSHETPLIAMIAVGLTVALIYGLIAIRLRVSPLVGYLLAGITIGPFTPGYVGDIALARELAEIGVIFLMFGVGMHFSLRDLWAVRRIAVPGAIGQIAIATLLGAAVAVGWGWPIGTGIIFGLALSVASTVVLLRALRTDGTLNTENGKIAVGWLIVEDLVMVFALVLLPVFAGVPVQTPTLLSFVSPSPPTLAGSLLITGVEVAFLIAIILVIGGRIFPPLLRYLDATGSRELFTLAVVVTAVGVAYGSALAFGVSFALGAFFAGIMINESEVNQRVERSLRPLEDVFAVLFFVSIGMLFDPGILLREPLGVAAALAIVVAGKSIVALAIVRALRRPLDTALTVSAGLAQIGEFSFVLGAMAVSFDLLPTEGFNVIIAAALMSIVLNPLIFHAVRALRKTAPHLEREP